MLLISEPFGIVRIFKCYPVKLSVRFNCRFCPSAFNEFEHFPQLALILFPLSKITVL